MKRQYLALGLAAGLGAAGLVMLPSAEATAPCGLYQNPNGTNSTGNNETESLLNLNNVANMQGNTTSGASNVLCGARIGSGNQIVLFGDAAPSETGPSGARCETTQNNSGTNKTGDNKGKAETNINNVANSQGNLTSGASNVLCDADILSGNRIVLFGTAPSSSPSSSTSSPSQGSCTEKQSTFKPNTTGLNAVTGLFGSMLTNINNVGNNQGNITSGASNVLCQASIGSGNTTVVNLPPMESIGLDVLAQIMAQF